VLNVRPSFWLIGNDLVKVFEKHFAKQAARTRNSDGQPDSPFVRFVTAVTAELGEPVVDETVSKAMSAVAKVKTTPPVVTSPVAQAPPPPPPTGATDAATEQDQGRVLFDTPIGPADERGATLQPGQEAPGEIGPPTGAKVKTDD